MRKFVLGGLFGALLLMVLFLVYQRYNTTRSTEIATSRITQQIQQVSKLVVTELHYTEVITYKDKQHWGFDWLQSQKEALIVAEVDVDVRFDLSQLKYRINEEEQTIYIEELPAQEIKVYPQLTYYHLNNGYVNRFTAADFNTIKKQVKDQFYRRAQEDVNNQKTSERLLSELSKIQVLTSALGWKLVYEQTEITKEDDWHSILP